MDIKGSNYPSLGFRVRLMDNDKKRIGWGLGSKRKKWLDTKM